MEEQKINVDLSQSDDYYMTIFKKKIPVMNVIIVVCWFIGIIVICGFTLFEGFQSYFKYHDEVYLAGFWNWLLRKDILDLPMEPLIVSLLGVTLIFGGVEISTSWFINRDTHRGDIKPLPKKQRDRLLHLVVLWFIMVLIITVGKFFLGTRGVNYNETLIYSGFGESFVLYTLAIRTSKLSNYSHKSTEDAVAQITKVVKEELANQQQVEEENYEEH